MKLNESRANLIVAHLNRLKQTYENLVVVETGTIRNVNPEYIVGDGHSTHLIAQWIKDNGGNFFSIDLDISVADKYLKDLRLRKWVQLQPYESITFLNILKKQNLKIHLAYLDSGNDATLILNEFKVVENMILPGGVVIIDDCKPGDKSLLKGNEVIPYAQNKGYKINLKERQGVIWI